MKKYSFIILFVGILFLGIFFRIYHLGKTPNSLDWDEVSWGYNTYSVLTTGKDEYGVFLPHIVRSFNDYKNPLYLYLDLLPIKAFGLTPFAVRLPSAFFGSVSILGVYFLTQELFQKRKEKKWLSLLTMLFYALSPWSIQFSRVAFESNVALSLVIIGAAVFLYGLRSKKITYLFLAVIPFSLSTYAYHSEKIFTTLLLFSFILYGYRFFKQHKKLAVLVIVFFFLCNGLWLIDKNAATRGRNVLFTSQQSQLLAFSNKELLHDKNNRDMFGEFMHNRRMVFAKVYIQNYLLHFDPNFLFIFGDMARHHPPQMGDLYLVLLPFIIIGIIVLLENDFESSWIIFIWFLLAPSISALTIDAPNATRSLIFLPTWDIFAACGVFYILKKTKMNKYILTLLFLIFTGNVVYYAHNYFTHTDTDFSKYWQGGYKEAVLSASEIAKGKNIFYSKELEQPYIFYLFYSSYDPVKYLASGGSLRTNAKCYSIENAYFGDCSEKVKPGDIIVTANDSYSDSRILKKILYPNGEHALTLLEKQ